MQRVLLRLLKIIICFHDEAGVPMLCLDLHSQPIYCDGLTDFILVWGIQPRQNVDARYNWKAGNFFWGFKQIGE